MNTNSDSDSDSVDEYGNVLLKFMYNRQIAITKRLAALSAGLIVFWGCSMMLGYFGMEFNHMFMNVLSGLMALLAFIAGGILGFFGFILFIDHIERADNNQKEIDQRVVDFNNRLEHKPL